MKHINIEHLWYPFYIFSKMTSKAEHHYKQICVPKLSFHYQLNYLSLPNPCFCNCFSVFWCKHLPRRRLCRRWLNHSIFLLPDSICTISKRNVKPHSQHIHQAVMVMENSILNSAKGIVSLNDLFPKQRHHSHWNLVKRQTIIYNSYTINLVSILCYKP